MDNDKKHSQVLEIRHFRAAGPRGEKKLVVERVTIESETAQFLTRVETVRLSKPYDGVVDMRDKVLFPCNAFQHNNKTHYLDDISLTLYKEEVKHNNGKLSVGGYERIIYGDHTLETRPTRPVDILNTLDNRDPHNHLPSAQPKQRPSEAPKNTAEVNPPTHRSAHEPPSATTNYTYASSNTPELIEFGYLAQRKEARLQYKMRVLIKVRDRSIEGICKDVSAHGVQFTYTPEPALVIAPDELIAISFPMLTDKDARFGTDAIPYQVVRAHNPEGQPALGCTLLDEVQFNWVIEFFRSFIEQESKRYKIDAEDEIITRTALCYQQLHNHASTNIPLFFSNKNAPYLETLGINQKNISLLDFFSTGGFSYDFSPLRIAKRIRSILPSKGQKHQSVSSLLVMFKIKNVIYSATPHDFTEAKDFNAFLRYAFSQKQMRVFKITTALINQALSDTAMMHLTQELFNKSQEEHALLKEKLSQLCAIGQLTDVSALMKPYFDNAAAAVEVSQFRCWRNNQLISFADNSNVYETCELNAPPQHLPFKYYPPRRETRYIARTPINITIDGKRHEGITRDLSVKGLRAELNSHVSIERGLLVYVGFLNFNQKRSGFDIDNILYKVVDVYYEENKTVFSMSREKDDQWVHATAFFEDIIEVNRGKLRECINDLITATMAGAYEQTYSSHLTSIAFFLSRRPRGNVGLDYAVKPQNAAKLVKFFTDRHGKFNLSPLASGELLKHIHKVNKDAKALIIYCYKEQNEHGQLIVRQKSNYELNTHEENIAFIKKSISCPEFLFLAATPSLCEANWAYLETQINQLNALSRHHAAKLQEQLEQILAQGEFIDVTQDILTCVAKPKVPKPSSLPAL